MTRRVPRICTATLRYLIAALALLPTLALVDIARPVGVIDGDKIEILGSGYGCSAGRTVTSGRL